MPKQNTKRTRDCGKAIVQVLTPVLLRDADEYTSAWLDLEGTPSFDKGGVREAERWIRKQETPAIYRATRVHPAIEIQVEQVVKRTIIRHTEGSLI